MNYEKRKIELTFSNTNRDASSEMNHGASNVSEKKINIQLQLLNSLNKTIDDVFSELVLEGREKELDLLCPYFGVLWPSAMVLTNEVFKRNLETEKGPMRLLEVGCELALPSLVLSKLLKTSKITVSDFHPEVEVFLKINTDLNGLKIDPENSPHFEYIFARFGELKALNRKWDVVIGSDILYESSHPEELAEALNDITHPNGEIIITDPGRPYLQKFSDQMKLRGWFSEPKIIKVEKDEYMEMDSSFKEIYLFNFKKDKRNLFSLRLQ